MTACSLLLLITLSACWAALPDGYILEVEPECGYEDDEGATITVTTDLQIGIRALCEGSQQGFVTSDAVHYQLAVGYPTVGSHACIFKTSTHPHPPHVYEMKLIISFREVLGLPPQPDQEMTVFCRFDPRRADKSGQGFVQPLGVLPLPIEDESDPRVDLRILDEGGRDVSGRQLTMGHRALLQASLTGSDHGQGLRPVSCDAVGISGERYAIIRAGCGDGIVFDSDSGFIGQGNVSKSPYFSVFRFPKADLVNFDCSFTLCENNCDGSSCLPGTIRDRRSERRQGKLVRAQSSKVSISLRDTANDTLKTVVVVKKPQTKAAVTTSLLYNPNFLTPIVVLGAIALASCLIAVCACAKRNSSQLYEVEKEGAILDGYDVPFNSKIDMKSKPRGNRNYKTSCIKNCELQKCTCVKPNCGCAKPNCRCVKHACEPDCRLPCLKPCDCSADCGCAEANNVDVYESLYTNPWSPELCAADCLKPCSVGLLPCTEICNK